MPMDGSGRVGGNNPFNFDPDTSKRKPDTPAPGSDVKPQTSTGHRLDGPPLKKRGIAARFKGPKLNIAAANTLATTPQLPQAQQLKERIAATNISDATPPQPITRGTFSMYPIRTAGVELYAHPGVRESQDGESFWSASEQAGTEKIIALETQLASEYIPKPQGDSINFGKYTVTATTVTPLQEMTGIPSDYKSASKEAKSIQATVTNNETGKSRNVTVDLLQLWEDGKGINNKLAEAMLERTPSTGCQIHCRAGLGRTGTLIVLKQMQAANDSGRLSKENLVSFISETVARGRAQRADGRFVQTEEQLQTLIDYGKELTGATDADIEEQLS